MTKNVDIELLKILKGKSILFIEGDLGLHNSVGVLAKFLFDNKIHYNSILNAGAMTLEGIIELVDFHDVIIWQSTYSTETAANIMKALFDDKVTRHEACGCNVMKILLEVYICDPYNYYKPEGLKKRVMGLTGLSDYDDEGDHENWRLYEYKDDQKPTWEKEDDEL